MQKLGVGEGRVKVYVFSACYGIVSCFDFRTPRISISTPGKTLFFLSFSLSLVLSVLLSDAD